MAKTLCKEGDMTGSFGVITHKHNISGDLEIDKFFDLMQLKIGENWCWLDDEGLEKLKKIIQKFEEYRR